MSKQEKNTKTEKIEKFVEKALSIGDEITSLPDIEAAPPPDPIELLTRASNDPDDKTHINQLAREILKENEE